jgi:crossover junction endodeoxyribonuclease RusA
MARDGNDRRQWLLRLAWPAAPLWQNRRYHRAVVARAKATQRREAWALAHQQLVPRLPDAILEFEFHPPMRSRPDAQNLPATIKSAVDGIADGMRCDDKGFQCRFPDTVGEKVEVGYVLVTIKEPEA